MYGSGQSALNIEGANSSEYVGATTGKFVVRYITNHDVNGSDGTPLDLFGGKKGSMGAFIIAAYMKGVPMIYNGQEVGTPFRLPFPFTSAKIDWTLNPDVTADYKKVIAFRNGSQAIKSGILTSYSTADVCVFTKVLGTEKIMIIVNCRNAVTTYTLPSPFANTTVQDVLNGGNISLTTELTLQPYNYFVFKI